MHLTPASLALPPQPGAPVTLRDLSPPPQHRSILRSQEHTVRPPPRTRRSTAGTLVWSGSPAFAQATLTCQHLPPPPVCAVVEKCRPLVPTALPHRPSRLPGHQRHLGQLQTHFLVAKAACTGQPASGHDGAVQVGRHLGEGVQAPGLLGPTWGCDLETSWCKGAWVAVVCWAGRAA